MSDTTRFALNLAAVILSAGALVLAIVDALK